MKLKVILNDERDTDLIPPMAWDQVKRAIHETGKHFGLHIEFPGDVATRDALDERWREAVGKYRGE